jgi:DNA gyrase/topoisomerase IV subunit B
LKPGCDQLFRAARNDNQARKRGARRAGEVYTVRYDAVNAMLLNEFLKEHKKVEKQEATITRLTNDFQTVSAQQRNEIQLLSAQLKEQAAQIQKVSAQLEASKPAPQVVNNP